MLVMLVFCLGVCGSVAAANVQAVFLSLHTSEIISTAPTPQRAFDCGFDCSLLLGSFVLSNLLTILIYVLDSWLFVWQGSTHTHTHIHHAKYCGFCLSKKARGEFVIATKRPGSAVQCSADTTTHRRRGDVVFVIPAETVVSHRADDGNGHVSPPDSAKGKAAGIDARRVLWVIGCHGDHEFHDPGIGCR